MGATITGNSPTITPAQIPTTTATPDPKTQAGQTNAGTPPTTTAAPNNAVPANNAVAPTQAVPANNAAAPTQAVPANNAVAPQQAVPANNAAGTGAATPLQTSLPIRDRDCWTPPVITPQIPTLPQFPNLPPIGCIPQPQIDLSGPPAGKGLTTGQEGWPQNTITTAGGYHIVPEGNTNWSIFAPGQAQGDKAHTRIWGDPHVAEKDGTNWDFTKSSDFVLGDGTRIHARTSADTGQSVTVGLDIVNGADRIAVSNVDKQPQLSAITQDGYEWRAKHVASDPNRDTFYLKGDQNNVQWLRERNQKVDGVVTGATFDAKQNRYEQTVDGNVNATIDASLRPPLGSRAWGNLIRGAIDDQQAKTFANIGNAFGAPQLGVAAAEQGAQRIHGDHNRAAFAADVRDFYNSLQQFFPFFGLFGQGGQGGLFNQGGFGQQGGLEQLFGGWGGAFNNFQQPFDAISLLRNLLFSANDWTRQYQFGMNNFGGI